MRIPVPLGFLLSTLAVYLIWSIRRLLRVESV